MRRFAVVFWVFVLLLNLSGCPLEPPPLKGDSEMRSLVAAMNEAEQATEPGKKVAAAEKVKAATAALERLNLTAEEKKKLNDKYK